MKQCPQCRQTFSDETYFCLSDGTPLPEGDEAPEEITVIKSVGPTVRTSASQEQKGTSRILVWVAGGLVLLILVLGVIGVAIITIRRNWKNEIPNNSSNSNVSNRDEVSNRINKEKSNLQEQQDQIEKEKRRLAEERKKLNEDKNKTAETPLPSPTRTTSYPAQPTARIKFGRGRVAESVSGKIYTQRSYVLEARSGQYLSATITGGGCVTFSNGATSLGYVTGSGDNRITLVNNCGTEAGFSLTVSIK